MYNIEVIKGGDVVEINIPDSTFNTDDTTLTLIGRDAVSYGEALNENMLKLLSNSAGPTEPAQPIIGELWFNTLEQKIYLNGIKGFSVLGSATWSPTQPSIESSNVGDLWVKSTTRQLYVFGGDTYTLIGPSYDTRNGITSLVDEIVNDVSGVGHIIGIVKVAGNDLGFFSNEPFTYPGYGEVVRGFNPLGSDFTINATILSAKNLERGTDLIPASDIAVKGESADFYDVSTPLVKTDTIEVGNISITADVGNLNINSNLKVNALDIGGVMVSHSGPAIVTDILETTEVRTTSLTVNRVESSTDIDIFSPVVLEYESTSPSDNPLSPAPRKYVDEAMNQIMARPLTVTMHTPALDIPTLQGAIVQYLTKLFPTNQYPLTTTIRVIAVQTQVKNKLLVSDYASATVHVYELQTGGWQYMYSEE